MITIEGITLHDDLRMSPEPEMIPTRVQETMPTRGGHLIRWEKTLMDRPFDLVGGDGWAWMPLSVMQSLKALADTDGYEGNLNMHGTVLPVYFRHTDSPVIEFVPVIDYSRNPAVVTDLVKEIKIKLVWKYTP